MRSTSSECDSDAESPVLLTHRNFTDFFEDMTPLRNFGGRVETFLFGTVESRVLANDLEQMKTSTSTVFANNLREHKSQTDTPDCTAHSRCRPLRDTDLI